MASHDLGVNVVCETLQNTLRQYIEAQYHIRNENLIDERKALLNMPETIYQTPYIEATPVYQIGSSFDQLDIPSTSRQALTELAALDVGIYSKPYVHQAEALEAFLGGKDILVATGTGSGKTESFLMPIIGSLAVEAAERPASARLPGCRALLLYPMNALVNDQLSRIRKIFGTAAAAKVIAASRGRNVRFGTYTGRTPYPGERSAGKDTHQIKPLFEDYYLKLLREDKTIVAELNERGKWPSKDLEAFYRADLVEKVPIRSGRNAGDLRNSYHWGERLKTGADDRELMMRHEVQHECPDLLITNYSMLEYMLMRPIERPIFAQTKAWLDSDSRNEFILVVDEAHMYYGAAGAEVALLIRRLMSRLGIPRERMRCILTSASLGGVEEDAILFARDLTGLQPTSPVKFVAIKGTLETRSGAKSGESTISHLLAKLLIRDIESFPVDLLSAIRQVNVLFEAMNWPMIPEDASENEFRDQVFHRLTGFGPFELLIKLTEGRAIELASLAEELFPDSDQATRMQAVSALLALATAAKRMRDDRVLLPARVHMLYRGLPALFACTDPRCDQKRAPGEGSIAGKLYTDARLSCECARRARVYELFTHRDCGAAFLHGYVSGATGTFLWNESSHQLGDAIVAPVSKMELLIDGPPHSDIAHKRQVWLDLTSGRLSWIQPPNPEGFREAWVPDALLDRKGEGFLFPQCPVCLGKWKFDSSKIMDHETKGEAPFAALVSTQLQLQPPSRAETEATPNGGRKVLLFSDGRQKAARLARDIPREVERDVFREAMACACKKLNNIGLDASPNLNLYVSLLSVLSDNNLVLFEGADRDRVIADRKKYEKDFAGDLIGAVADLTKDLDMPQRFRREMLRQLCGRFYSINELTIGYVEPAKRDFNNLKMAATNIADISEADIRALSFAWIGSCLEEFAIDANVAANVRDAAAGYHRPSWGVDGRFDDTFRRPLIARLGFKEDAVTEIERLFVDLCDLKPEDGLYLTPRKVKICIDLQQSWLQCRSCTRLAPMSFRGHCLFCGRAELIELDPLESKYFSSRKNYWRLPVERALTGGRLKNVSVEEHTAQLSHRDRGIVHATTERFELRFQDLLLDDDTPIDVLSCTTTMEVGIDIGPLLAVGLRNVPPQRSNYQQRAGRVGRRGSAVSTVLTYAQNGPHDGYYFRNPREIIAGTPQTPRLKIDNPKIARRHVYSFLFQTFFDQVLGDGQPSRAVTSNLYESLGKTSDFFHPKDGNPASLAAFSVWAKTHVVGESGDLRGVILSWLPDGLKISPLSNEEWLVKSTVELIDRLYELEAHVPVAAEELPKDEDGEEVEVEPKALLLDFLFEENLLPTYAFPTSLASFLIEKYKNERGYREVATKEKPQQALDKALSEYAPGRLVVINKETYRSGGVTAAVLQRVEDRAAPLFEHKKELVYCSRCTYVQEGASASSAACPVCRGVLETHTTIQPEVFLPENAGPVQEGDREQEITYATMAQFPVPVGDHLGHMKMLGDRASFTHSVDRRLISVNKGQKDSIRSEYSGFTVCNKCGMAVVGTDSPRTHVRPYLIPHRVGQFPRRCNGTFETVFLGGMFTTDVFLLRFNVAAPVIVDTSNPQDRHILEDALYTIAEAVVMAAARHPELDLNPRELGSGFRIIPTDSLTERTVDVYLYDTSSGGAGYSEIAARYANEIVAGAIELLEHCPNNCDRSCQDCLRNYYNQHLQNRLDRHLGAQFLRYAMFGEIPQRLDARGQARELWAVARYLQLEGWQCRLSDNPSASEAPLIVSNGSSEVAVGTYPSLLQEQCALPDAWEQAIERRGGNSLRISNFEVARNIPDVHRIITRYLEPVGL